MSFRVTLILLTALAAFVHPAYGKTPDNATKEKADDAPPDWDVSNPPGEWREISIDTRTTTFETFSVTFFSLNVVSLAPLSPTRLPPTTHTKLWNSSPPGHHAPPLSTLTPCPLSPHTPCAPHHSSPHIPLRLRATHTCTRTHPRTLSPTLYV